MDKLESYLDQVCRGIGGPRSLRQHIRQELREHLRDAVAEHRAAGLSEEAALTRAFEHFGRPDEVRSDLEATHGQRLMAVVIDKALEWKEKTMKAKWLWASWAHLALAGVVAAERSFITFAVIFIVPRFQMFMREGWIAADSSEPMVSWVPSFFRFLGWMAQNTTWLLMVGLVLWGLFEWRVRSENKSFMRMAALATGALSLMVVVMLMGWALVLPVAMELPALEARKPEQVVMDKEASIDRSVADLEQALANRDWGTIQLHADNASQTMHSLALMGAAGPALAALHEQPQVEELRGQLKAAQQHFNHVHQAAHAKDPERLEAALKTFQEAYKPLRDAANMPRK
ncbi:MAG: permease prefix domain 1-containing protein [Gemmataceae bacterium]